MMSNEDPIHELYIADPEFAREIVDCLSRRYIPLTLSEKRLFVEETIWGLSQEESFGKTIAFGYIELLGMVSDALIQRYRTLVRRAGQHGPTLGRFMASTLAPVLKLGNDRFLDHFLSTVNLMMKKGTYTLNTPFSVLVSFLNTGGIDAGFAYLNLLDNIYSNDMSYNQSLHLTHTLPKAVVSFAPSRRIHQIEQLNRVVNKDFRLAEPFIDGMDKGLRFLTPTNLAVFIDRALEKYDDDPQLGKKYIGLESKLGVTHFQELKTIASIWEILPRLNRYLRARTGQRISVQPKSAIPQSYLRQKIAEDHVFVLSDGKTIYLPEEIGIYENKTANDHLYACLVKLEAAYYEFGTFDFDIEKFFHNMNLSVPEEKRRHDLSDLEQYFSLFFDKHFAAVLFTLFEHGRIYRLLRRKYPGIIEKTRPEILREIKTIHRQKNSNPVLLYLYTELTISDGDFGINTFSAKDFCELDNLNRQIQALFEEKLQSDPTVYTSAEMVYMTFRKIYFTAKMISSSALILNVPFSRHIRPDLFFAAFKDHDRLAQKIKSALEKQGVRSYKADIRKQLIEKKHTLSPEDIEKTIVRPEPEGGDEGSIEDEKKPDLSFLKSLFDRSSEGITPEIGDSENAFWYREWDAHLNDYMYDHVMLRERRLEGVNGNFYQKTLSDRQGLVSKIRRMFELMKPEGLKILRQWTEGDEFDYRALLDFALDRKAGISPSDRLYIKRLKQDRDVAVLLLVDLSRSTSNIVAGRQNTTVLDVEKEAIVLFCEALDVLGDRFSVAGFSGTGRLGVDYYIIKEFHESLDDAVRNRIGRMSPQRNTRMGGAIRHAVRKLSTMTAKIRLLIILSDGFPNDMDYKREYAVEDTRKALLEARSENIFARAITVNLAMDSGLDDLYGALQHNLIEDVRELPDKLLQIYSAMTRS